MEKIIHITIIIVTYNTKKLLTNCLESIYKYKNNLNLKIIIIDNASSDNTASFIKKKFPQIKIIINKKNLLFSQAYNQGLKNIKSKYFLILNSDTTMHKNTLTNMYQFMEKYSHCGISTCIAKDEQNKIIETSHESHKPITQIFELPIFYKFLKNHYLLNEFRYRKWNRKSTRQVESIPGSFMFVKSKMIKEIGLFDEKMRLFYSDADYCRRINNKGFELYHNANTSYTHLIGQTLNHFSQKKIITLSYSDMTYYYEKYYGIYWSKIIKILSKICLWLKN
jgi:GT2 family glycosyltransferase